MIGLRGQIVAAMGVSFVAGIPAGVMVAERDSDGPLGDGPFAAYAALLDAEFDLEPERERALRVILADHHRTLEEIRSRQLDRFEDEVVRAGRLCRSRIRDYLLREEDRARFDQLAALPEAATTGP